MTSRNYDVTKFCPLRIQTLVSALCVLVGNLDSQRFELLSTHLDFNENPVFQFRILQLLLFIELLWLQ